MTVRASLDGSAAQRLRALPPSSSHEGDVAAGDVRTELPLLVAELQWRDTQRRRDLFGTELFGDPAWNILLALFIAKQRGRKITLTACCVASCRAASTGMGYVRLLEQAGHLLRHRDQADARCVALTLHPATAAAIEQHLTKFYMRCMDLPLSS